jgi:hypothetical protein
MISSECFDGLFIKIHQNAQFPRHFRAPNNIIKYDGKTNPSIWLEDYRLACRVGEADDDMFII